MTRVKIGHGNNNNIIRVALEKYINQQVNNRRYNKTIYLLTYTC